MVSYVFPCRARQYDNSWMISSPRHCGGSSSSSSSRSGHTRKQAGPKVENYKSGTCCCWCCLVLLLELLMQLLATHCGCTTTDVDQPLLLQCSYAVFPFVVFFFFLCRTSSLPFSTSKVSPAEFGLPCLQTHQLMMKRELTLLSARKKHSYIPGTRFRKYSTL